MTRFQEQKTADIGLAFHEFAEGQTLLGNSLAEAWRSLFPMLETPLFGLIFKAKEYKPSDWNSYNIVLPFRERNAQLYGWSIGIGICGVSSYITTCRVIWLGCSVNLF